MEYITRTVRSRPGLTQEEALDSLQTHPSFKPGTKIASLRRRGDRWVAKLSMPKVAGPFPPPGNEEAAADKDEAKAEKDEDEAADDVAKEESSDDGDPADLGDGPPDDFSDGPPKPGAGGKGGTEEQILHVLTEILHAVKGGPDLGGIGGPDGLGPGPDGPPGPPPGLGGPPAGPGAGKGPMGGAGSKLRPGEVPNKPGVTPIGSPAFASTKQAGPYGSDPAGAPVGMPGAGAAGGGTCPKCGGPVGPDGSCPTCQGAMPASQPGQPGMSPLASKIAALAGRKATIPVSSPASMSIKEAKVELEQAAAPFGYRVAQVKYCGPNCQCGNAGSNKVHALLTVR